MIVRDFRSIGNEFSPARALGIPLAQLATVAAICCCSDACSRAYPLQAGARKVNVWVAPTIVDCEISPDLASLSITAPDGRRIALGAEQLRLACKCAQCRRAQFDDRFPSSFPGIAIVAVTDLGYGVNISFSDGHDRGIYPKSYLAELAEI